MNVHLGTRGRPTTITVGRVQATLDRHGRGPRFTCGFNKGDTLFIVAGKTFCLAVVK